MSNNGRINPKKQRLRKSTKLASCPRGIVSRGRAPAPPFPIQISARGPGHPPFPSKHPWPPAAGPGLLQPGLRAPAQPPAPLLTGLRDPSPASCYRVSASSPPGLALQPGLHCPASTFPAQSPASRRNAPGLVSQSWTRLPSPSSALLSSSRVSAPRPSHPPPDRVSRSAGFSARPSPVVVAKQRIRRTDRAHLLRHPGAAASPDWSLGRVLSLAGWRELAQG